VLYGGGVAWLDCPGGVQYFSLLPALQTGFPTSLKKAVDACDLLEMMNPQPSVHCKFVATQN